MFKIVRFPAKLESFFTPLQDHFLFNHFDYLRDLVLATAFSWERRNISALHRHLDADNQTHRSRFNNFLNVDRWNPEAALQDKAYFYCDRFTLFGQEACSGGRAARVLCRKRRP